jgi:hypothetical protein
LSSSASISESGFRSTKSQADVVAVTSDVVVVGCEVSVVDGLQLLAWTLEAARAATATAMVFVEGILTLNLFNEKFVGDERWKCTSSGEMRAHISKTPGASVSSRTPHSIVSCGLIKPQSRSALTLESWNLTTASRS